MAGPLVRVGSDRPAPTTASRVNRVRQATSSIRTRVLLWYLLLFAATTIVAIVAIGQILSSRVDGDVDDAITREVEEFQLLAQGIDPATGEPFGTDLAAIFSTYSAQNVAAEGEVFLGIIDGRLHDGSPRHRADQIATDDLVAEWATVTEPTWGESLTSLGSFRWLAVPLVSNDELTDGRFVAAVDVGAERGEVSSTVRAIGLVLVIVLLVAAAIGWAATGRVLAPLNGVIEMTRRLTAVDLSKRMPVDGDDEIAELTETLNGLLDRIETAIPIQLQFLDDLGHEFKKPISTIRSHLDDLPDEPEARRDAIDRCRHELDRVDNDLADLRTLAEATQPDFLVLREVGLHLLVADIRTLAREVAPGRLWEIERTHEGAVLCDPDPVKQAMLNLIANAPQHTGPGDRIVMGGEVLGDRARLWVYDDGPVIRDREASRLFERIGASNGSDSAQRVTSGLRLPVVAAIADAPRRPHRDLQQRDRGHDVQHRPAERPTSHRRNRTSGSLSRTRPRGRWAEWPTYPVLSHMRTADADAEPTDERRAANEPARRTSQRHTRGDQPLRRGGHVRGRHGADHDHPRRPGTADLHR